MDAKHGICALCRLERDLQSSHLLPKALYRFVSGIRGKGDPNPVIVAHDSAWQSSKQVEAHLLCTECEQRFHKEGEEWTLRHCYRGERRFRLQEALERSTPIEESETAKLFAAHSVTDIAIDRLVYFAASVFWRASVNRWRLQDHYLEHIDLGEKYTEQLRGFLLGAAGFPKDAAVLIDIFGFRSPLSLATMLFPYGGRRDAFYHYRFTIPGLAFNLYIGQLIPSALRECSVLRSTGILISSKRDTSVIEDFAIRGLWSMHWRETLLLTRSGKEF